MGCIKSNDKVINPQFSDENSALWKKVNKLPRDGSLIEPCGEEMCYVCTETTEDGKVLKYFIYQNSYANCRELQ